LSGSHSHALHYHGHTAVHRAAPQVKLIALLVYVFAVVATPPEVVWAFSGHAVVLLVVVALSGVPVRFFLTRLAIDLPFLLFAFLLPFVGADPRVDIGPVSISEPGLLGSWNILAKATLGTGASVLLIATTEVAAVLAGMRRLRVPVAITAIAAFMIRYLEVIAGELHRLRVAMTARGSSPSWFGQARPLAVAAGALFIRSYERGERVHQAMLARGFTGDMPAGEEEEPVRWGPAIVVAGAAVCVSVVARIVG
jgi:cobalt/nickel transport system permease protein